MKRQVILTVSESKRLIAKAVASLEIIRSAKKEGMIIFAPGTTVSYVIEEILGISIDKRAYRHGITTPEKPELSGAPEPKPMPDLILRKGEVVKGIDRFEAIKEIQRGDVFIKGPNALDYNNKVAGVLIGGRVAGGGDIGHAVGALAARKGHLVIPVGLEKLVYHDIYSLSRVTYDKEYEGPTLLPVTGVIVTEIEALELLTGVKSILLAAGGIAGAEGAVRLLIDGSDAEVNKALDLVKSIKGEPRYLL